MSINKDLQKTPNLRFKGFTDDWEQGKLGEVLSLLKDGTHGTHKDVLDGPFLLSAKNIKNGKINILDSERKISTKDFQNIHKNFQLKTGDVLLTIVGSIGQAAILYNPNEVTFQRSVAYLRPKNMPSTFLYTLVTSPNFQNKLKKNQVISAQPGIYLGDLSNIIINIPKENVEQVKLGLLFKQLSNIITLHQRKLDQLNQVKEALLQQMFPGKGETVPKLRFAGFEGDWEERKLGEASDVRDGTHASPKYINQGHPMVTSKNLTSSGLDMTDVSFLTDEDFNEINKRSKVSIGDILFGMIGTIGNPVIVDRTDFAIKNVALIKEKSYNPITNKWLLQYLKSPSFNQFIQKENAGGTQKFIALGLIRDMILKVPGLQEQQEIGTFLEQLDNTITLHQRKLDQIKNMKKVLLQNMFI